VKIKHIEPIAVSLPLTKPVKMAGVELTTADNLVVRIESDGGIVGWGESASAPIMTGETVESMVAAVRHLAHYVEGRAADDFAGASSVMNLWMYGNQAAKGAIEMAMHDLVGRATGQPVHALLGGKRRERVSTLWMISGGNAEADVREAKELLAAGYVAYKVKVGVNSPEIDAERTRRVCETLGPGFLISADANQGWTTDEGERYVHGVAATLLDFFEQPVRQDDLAGMARIAAASRVPICADEGIHSLDHIRRHHAAGAARGVSLKSIKLGGLRGVMDAGKLCAELGMEVNVACKTAESSIASAAAVHLAAALPSNNWSLNISSPYLAQDLTAQPLKVERGHVVVPDAPGLGIEVDEARVRRFQRRL
jgi:L-alanine-DL-glutamate epimerase-like enolase superfamily enzyme